MYTIILIPQHKIIKTYFTLYKLNQMLKELRKDTSKVTEESTVAYEQRDEAHNKMFMLKDKCEKDIQLFNAEIRVSS